MVRRMLLLLLELLPVVLALKDGNDKFQQVSQSLDGRPIIVDDRVGTLQRATAVA